MNLDLYNLFALAVAGASGGLFYWAIRNSKRAYVRVKARVRRR
jgi:hypothetical protein